MNDYAHTWSKICMYPKIVLMKTSTHLLVVDRQNKKVITMTQKRFFLNCFYHAKVVKHKQYNFDITMITLTHRIHSTCHLYHLNNPVKTKPKNKSKKLVELFSSIPLKNKCIKVI